MIESRNLRSRGADYIEKSISEKKQKIIYERFLIKNFSDVRKRCLESGNPLFKKHANTIIAIKCQYALAMKSETFMDMINNADSITDVQDAVEIYAAAHEIVKEQTQSNDPNYDHKINAVTSVWAEYRKKSQAPTKYKKLFIAKIKEEKCKEILKNMQSGETKSVNELRTHLLDHNH